MVTNNLNNQMQNKQKLINLVFKPNLVFICSVMNKLNDFIKEVNRIPFDFIWNHKASRIKKLQHERPSSLRQGALN